MPRLVLSCSTLAAGGAARVISNLSQPLADTFDSVTYVLWAKVPGFYEVDPRIKIVWVDDEAGNKELARLRWFRRFVKRDRPDLILSFLEPYNIRVLLSTIGLGIKTIVAERNDPKVMNGGPLMDFVERTVYRLADGILVQTPTVAGFFRGALSGRTSIIYNPVNLPADIVGSALSVKKENRIVSVARLKEQKKHDVLIRAFGIFVRDFPEYKLEIYGEGPCEDSLNALIESEGLDGKAFLMGTRQDIHAAIRSARIFALVSDREGMSNAMIESMCLGLPCICTKVSGAVDLIQSGSNGLLVDVDNVQQVVDAMRTLASNDSLSYEIGANAARLYEKLNKDIIYKQWLDYINEQL